MPAADRPGGAPARIRDVVFDLGGVLVDWDPRHLLCRRLGHAPEAVERFLAQVWTSHWHMRLDAGEPFERIAGALIEAHPDERAWIEAYVRDWPHMFAGDFPAAVDALHALKRKGVRVHALSNYPGEQVAFLYRTYRFMREFHTVVLSGLTGLQKPDPAIFDYLLERIGRRPCLFVDDRSDNVEAALSCGIEAVHVGPDGVAWGELVARYAGG